MARKKGIMLADGDFGTYEIVNLETDESILIQTDWDYPGVASTFGWNIGGRTKCKHYHTDGTINCPDCGKTATEFITQAGEYLDKHIGKVVADPGYFD